MVIPEPHQYCNRLIQELKSFNLPVAGAVRRRGAKKHAKECVQYIQRDVLQVEVDFVQGKKPLSKSIESVTELVLELGSLLYAFGAAPLIWRYWMAWGSLGKFFTHEFYDAALWAALAREWQFIKTFPPLAVSNSRQISDLVMCNLLTNGDLYLPDSAIPDNEYEEAWLQLSQSIPNQLHSNTENSFKIIANYWMAEDAGDWKYFHPRSYPDFEGPVCAMVALACTQGYVPQTLDSNQLSFLEVGLAQFDFAPLFQ